MRCGDVIIGESSPLVDHFLFHVDQNEVDYAFLAQSLLLKEVFNGHLIQVQLLPHPTHVFDLEVPNQSCYLLVLALEVEGKSKEWHVPATDNGVAFLSGELVPIGLPLDDPADLVERHDSEWLLWCFSVRPLRLVDEKGLSVEHDVANVKDAIFLHVELKVVSFCRCSRCVFFRIELVEVIHERPRQLLLCFWT